MYKLDPESLTVTTFSVEARHEAANAESELASMVGQCTLVWSNCRMCQPNTSS